MPIILITGYPCSGKTTRAHEIIAAFTEMAPDRKLHLVSDDTLDIDKSVYRDAKQEKMARANIMSSIKRYLSREAIVIVDGLNYIKGFRYQIFCEAKAEKTTYAVVHVGTPVEVCQAWNASVDKNPWDKDLFDALVFRYEEPNGMNRWDSPLYTLPYSDPAITPNEGIFPPLFDSIIHSKVKPPNFATILKPAVSTDYIYELDKQTQEVVKRIVELQQEGGPGQTVVVCTEGAVVLPVENVAIAQLQRLRRNFVALNKVRQIDGGRIKSAFAEFLNRNFGTE
ncbi:chromatin associated protein KTI12 [Lipomyces tetrasporus]|uniref:Chromatin associated protein KTI12 n=1 Tax=Lipomyces tetrasporus TaxID=54092 RepID=A0AAD7QS86_9ASCO|nr:chromatin associated protein KTI12 [Lipomyces tetrasporus]KAJ8100564.1 chromatin associated protein KTI12 [Lipomyces tetrasporus]